MDNNIKTCNELSRKNHSLEIAHTPVDDKYASMNSLIAWNISKVLENNPNIDLKSKIKAMQERLDSSSWDVNSMVSHFSEERYLACAILAWQKMGQGDASTLYRFIQSNLNKASTNTSSTLVTEDIYVVSASNESRSPEVIVGHKQSIISNGIDSMDSVTYPHYRPVSSLPMETKIVMRCENLSKPKSSIKKQQNTKNSASQKNVDVEEPYGTKSPCQDRMLDLDKSNTDLRLRVQQLAKREEERVKLLTRAEATWKDLEKAYIRRLKVSEDKEEDLAKQIKSSIEERTDYKTVCAALAKQLEEREVIVQKETEALKKLESELCQRSGKKCKISEEIASVSSTLAHHHCRATQAERDLLFKEEQTKRKFKNLEEAAESSRALRYDTERALRMELSALKDEVAKVSKRLLQEENESKNINNELYEMRVNKNNILEDLDACKIMCDHLLQGKKTELKSKTEKLTELKDKVLECRCKMPQDMSVEAKRTPSLAAICRCCSDDNLPDSCSCTSLRSSVLSSLLRDLFAGLQSELSDNGSVMPCELLKCLEDKHNWDRAGAVKTNLRSFFSKLLVGELDIAIGSSIEKYHVKWVGTSCMDEASRIPNNVELEEWQQRALENRAQKMAKQLAEQLFQEKADELMEKAKDVLKLTPPPCECGTQSNVDYPGGRKTQTDISNFQNKSINDLKTASTTRDNNFKNVTQMHVVTQLLDKKSKIVRKNSMKPTKDRNSNKILRSHGGTNNIVLAESKKSGNIMNMNQIYHHRAVSTDKNENLSNWLLNSANKRILELSKPRDILKKRTINQSSLSKNSQNVNLRNSQNSKRRGQTYSVNLCLCTKNKDENSQALLPKNKIDEPNILHEDSIIQELDAEKITSSLLTKNTPRFEITDSAENPLEIKRREINRPFDLSCSGRDCKCLNSVPSNTSLNKLLDIFRHEEFKTTEFVKNESLKRLISTGESSLNLQKDMFTNTFDEIKPMKLETKFIDNVNLENDSLVKYPNISLQINHLEGDSSISKIVDYKDGDVNLCDNYSMENNVSDKTIRQNNNKENKALEKHENNIQATLKSEDKCTYAETKFSNTQTSVQSFFVQRNQHNINLIRNSIFDKSENSFNSTCPVTFLGVTLSNNESNNVSTCTYPLNHLSKKVTSHHVVSSTYCQYNTELDLTARKSSGKIGYNNNKNLSPKNDILVQNKLNCVCCKADENDDLEVNTFELLTEYLQKKLEDFKLSTYKAPNILPYEEDLLYTEILKKVKKLILEMNNEVLCTCFEDNKNDNIDACWKRACCLLQEYLQNKIKRITCSCTVTINNSNSILPGMLDKVCQLIEEDFKKLKMNYVDKNTLNIEKCNINEHINQNEIEESLNDILTKDIANVTSQMLVSICNTVHNIDKGNSDDKTKPLLAEDEEIKTSTAKSSADLSKFGVKSEQTGLSKTRHTSKTNSFHSVYSSLRYNNLTSQFTSTFSLNNAFDEKVFLSIFPEKNENLNVDTKENLSIPYIGYTLDCPCDKMLGPCICAKSALANKKNIYEEMWKVKDDINTSYIMQRANAENANLIPVQIVDQNIRNLVPDNSDVHEKVIDTNPNDGIRLKKSKQNLEQVIHNSTNTSHTCMFDEVDYSSFNEWDDCESSYSQNLNEASTNKEKLYDSLHLPIDYASNREKSKVLMNSDDVLIRDVRSDNCECEMVPICHVKMLIDNIERKLENCKCTCDSLTPNVCPIHYETVSL